MKILTVIGTRPEAIKMAPVMRRLQRTEGVESRVVLTGQHRDLVRPVLSSFAIRPSHDLAVMRDGQDLADMTSAILCGLRTVFRDFRPQRILVHGDTTTAMAASLAAFYERIPVGHIEAGLRTGRLDSPWPEELNRRLVTTVADLHFAPTRQARRNLLREGVPADHIFVTGNTVVDALDRVTRRLHSSPDLRDEIHHRYPLLNTRRRLILATVHRRENHGLHLDRIAEALRKIAAREDIEIVCPLHPNPNVRSQLQAGLAGFENIHLVDPLEYVPFVYLMTRSELILTDSGGIQEEAPILGKPVLVLRDTTERPESVAAGTVKVIGTQTNNIIASATQLLDDPEVYASMISHDLVHGDGRASQRIVRALFKVGLEAASQSTSVETMNRPTTRKYFVKY